MLKVLNKVNPEKDITLRVQISKKVDDKNAESVKLLWHQHWHLQKNQLLLEHQ